MVKFKKAEITTEKFYTAKISIKIWNVNVDNITTSKLLKRKTNSKYLIEQLEKDVTLLVF